MRIKCLALCIMIGSSLAAQERNKTSTYPGVQINFPIGEYANFVTIGYGATLNFDIQASEKTFLVISFGAHRYHGKRFPDPNLSDTSHSNSIFIVGKGGVKQQITPKFSAAIEAGLTMTTYDEGRGEFGGIFVPRIGYRFGKIETVIVYEISAPEQKVIAVGLNFWFL